MSLKSALSKLGSKLKIAVSKVTSNIKNVASKVVETVKDKSSAIVQTVASVCSGNVVGVVSGVANIISTPKKSDNKITNTTNNVTSVAINKNEVQKKSGWKTDYNKFTNMLRG